LVALVYITPWRRADSTIELGDKQEGPPDRLLKDTGVGGWSLRKQEQQYESG